MLESITTIHDEDVIGVDYEVKSVLKDVFHNGCAFVRQAPDYGRMFAFLVPGVVALSYEERPLTLKPNTTVFVDLTEIGPLKNPTEVTFNFYQERFDLGMEYRIKSDGTVLYAYAQGEVRTLSDEMLVDHIPLLKFASADIFRFNGALETSRGKTFYRTGFMDGHRDALFEEHNPMRYVEAFGVSFDDLLAASTPSDIAMRDLLSLQSRGYIDALTGKDVFEQFRDTQHVM